jgi:hypothetical protein
MRSLLLLAALVATPALAANGNVDKRVFNLGSGDPSKGAREIDIAQASDGTLVAAWLEGASKLTVAKSTDGGSTWTQLYRSSLLFTHVGGLSITLGRNGTGAPSSKMVYIGLGFVNGHQDKAGAWIADVEYVGLVSGPYDTAWRGPTIAFAEVREDDADGDGLFDGPADFDSPRVNAVLLSDPSSSRVHEPAIVWGDDGDIWVSVSHDFGRNLDVAEKITDGRDFATGDLYSSPSAAWDSKNSQLVVAFQDDTNDRVHAAVAAVQTPGAGSSVTDLVAGWSSDSVSSDRAWAPAVAVADGYTNLSFVRSDMLNEIENWDLTISSSGALAQPLTSSGFDVRSAPDIAIDGDTLTVTWTAPADNMPNSAQAVFRSRQPRLVFYGGDDPANQQSGRISDGSVHATTPGAPKVAVDPSGETTVYGWTTHDGGMPAGTGGDAWVDRE